jgi:hypothetical protein
MELLNIYLIFGFLIIILLICLLSPYITTYLNTEEKCEGFQGFSHQQVIDMSACVQGTTNCTYLKYYDSSGQLHSGYFSNLPKNFYLDGNDILQPVPSGYTATADYRGYVALSTTAAYAESARLAESALTSVSKCTESSLITDGYVTYNEPYLLPADYPYYPTTGVVCASVDYIMMDSSENLNTLHDTIIIPEGYYINAGVVTKIPYGYYASTDKRSIIITVEYQNAVSSTTYNPNNYDVTYHTEPSGGMIGTSSWILDHSGNLVSVSYSDISGKTLYNQPGSFRFGPSNYVPNYEESIYLSKLTHISTVTPISNPTETATGFCTAYAHDKNLLEQKCNALDTNACASTSCCVLFGGQKCVHGSDIGPYYKANYSNFMITNPEFYFYQGKCYGNCL